MMHSLQLNHLTISSTSKQVFPVDKSLPLQYTFVSNETGVVCLYCLNLILHQDVGKSARLPVLPQWIMENDKLLEIIQNITICLPSASPTSGVFLPPLPMLFCQKGEGDS